MYLFVRLVMIDWIDKNPARVRNSRKFYYFIIAEEGNTFPYNFPVLMRSKFFLR